MKKSWKKNLFVISTFVVAVCAGPMIASAGGRYSRTFPLSGGTGTITSAQMVDPYVPVDGTMNVTGALAATNGITSTAASTTIGAPRLLAGSLLQLRDDTAQGAEIRGYVSDSGTAKNITISANADLTTAGAKILSIGDNAGTSYSEKLYVDKDGDLVGASGTLVLGASSEVYTFAPSITGHSTDGGAQTWKLTGTTIQSGGSLSAMGITVVKTADYVATVADFLIPVDVATTGNVQVTLPAASAAKGQIIHIKAAATHATRVITIIRAGSDTIEGRTAADTSMTLSPTATLDHVSLISDGTSKWYLIDFSGTIT